MLPTVWDEILHLKQWDFLTLPKCCLSGWNVDLFDLWVSKVGFGGENELSIKCRKRQKSPTLMQVWVDSSAQEHHILMGIVALGRKLNWEELDVLNIKIHAVVLSWAKLKAGDGFSRVLQLTALFFINISPAFTTKINPGKSSVRCLDGLMFAARLSDFNSQSDLLSALVTRGDHAIEGFAEKSVPCTHFVF